MRSRISPAALFVKVIARIACGSTPASPIRRATRCVRTRVLPLPAPASTSSGPSPWRTASRCGGLRPSSRSVTVWILPEVSDAPPWGYASSVAADFALHAARRPPAGGPPRLVTGGSRGSAPGVALELAATAPRWRSPTARAARRPRRWPARCAPPAAGRWRCTWTWATRSGCGAARGGGRRARRPGPGGEQRGRPATAPRGEHEPRGLGAGDRGSTSPGRSWSAARRPGPCWPAGRRRRDRRGHQRPRPHAMGAVRPLRGLEGRRRSCSSSRSRRSWRPQRDPRERRRPRGDRHPHQRAISTRTRRLEAGSRPRSRWAGWGASTRSPPPWPGWRPTARPTSRARPCWSTAA